MKKIVLLIIINIGFVFAQNRMMVFYGTSLTVTGKWVNNLMIKLKAEFPSVKYYNAAKGGMNSIWGKQNLKNLVINKNPDILIMEFSINVGRYDTEYFF